MATQRVRRHSSAPCRCQNNPETNTNMIPGRTDTGGLANSWLLTGVSTGPVSHPLLDTLCVTAVMLLSLEHLQTDNRGRKVVAVGASAAAGLRRSRGGHCCCLPGDGCQFSGGSATTPPLLGH